MKNTIDDRKPDLSSEWKSTFERIKIQCFPHTIARLKDTVGCEPDWRVIKRIIFENWSAFEKGMDQREGYRLSTLSHLAQDQYRKWEHAIAMEDAEYLYAMEEA